MTRFVKIGRDALFLGAFLVLGSLIIAKVDLTNETVIPGPFFAIDGDTLAAGIERLRLLGIDAPESDQTCGDGKGGEWACGDAARKALSDLSSDTLAECRGEARDQYKRILVHCRRAGVDINAELVRRGLAVASGGYKAEETAARGEGRGIWAGPFDMPRTWRKSHHAIEDEPRNEAGFLDRLKGFFAW
ncbi:thermonuclease family protein [Neorhizobium alkalisoli]|uniref:Endonuclease YncB(Thermonuclease family) n=1 Tax=Neorhizobium alkalisoli TaxID=528178 RepID=A0A561QHC1_9HYPH|nr:thermonuclease family protein [Neorhizobium alkalisoli]TWF49758.1 endonuclease YncB(thermonuclease family) [Neorhizobium alkalisoli]